MRTYRYAGENFILFDDEAEGNAYLKKIQSTSRKKSHSKDEVTKTKVDSRAQPNIVKFTQRDH